MKINKLSSKTQQLIACPICTGTLKLGADTITCLICSKTYTIKNNIINLYYDKTQIIDDNNPIMQFDINEKFLKLITKKIAKISNKNIMTEYKHNFYSALIRVSITISCTILFITNPTKQIIFLYLLLMFVNFIIYRITCIVIEKNECSQILYMHSQNNINEYDIKTENINNDGLPTQLEFKETSRSILINFLLMKFLPSNAHNGIHLGCGGKSDFSVSIPYLKRNLNFIGIDIFQSYLTEYQHFLKHDAILANANKLPFKNDSMDYINATDIVEHFCNPVTVLAEIKRTLKKDGIAIIAVPNKARINFSFLNPMIFIEAIVGNIFSNILPPSEKLLRFNHTLFFHTAYTLNDLIKIASMNNFQIIYSKCHTYSDHKYKIIYSILEKMPILNRLNRYAIIVIKK